MRELYHDQDVLVASEALSCRVSSRIKMLDKCSTMRHTHAADVRHNTKG